MTQAPLFVDETEPCTRCGGDGVDRVFPDRPCRACGGSGRRRDQYDPQTAEIPF